MIKKRCKKFGCKNLHTNRNGYCNECNAQFTRERRANGEIEKPDGYSNYKWIKFSKEYLKTHRTCAICGRPATVVDHKSIPASVMLDLWGEFKYEDEYYQALCQKCNIIKGRYTDRQIKKDYEEDKKRLKYLLS